MALYFIWIRRDVRMNLNQCIGQLSQHAWLLMWHAGPYNNLMFTGPCVIVIAEESKNQLDATWYFIVLLIGSTCFKHYYAHHQELAAMMLITTSVVSFLVCCRLQVRCCSPDTTPAYQHLTCNLQQTKNETTNVVINIIVASSWWWA